MVAGTGPAARGRAGRARGRTGRARRTGRRVRAAQLAAGFAAPAEDVEAAGAGVDVLGVDPDDDVAAVLEEDEPPVLAPVVELVVDRESLR